MTWKKIIKNDMEQYERRMLREEKYGSPEPYTEEQKEVNNLNSTINHVQEEIKGAIRDLEHNDRGSIPTEEVEQLLMDLLQEFGA
jgi:hypothetical protein